MRNASRILLLSSVLIAPTSAVFAQATEPSSSPAQQETAPEEGAAPAADASVAEQAPSAEAPRAVGEGEATAAGPPAGEEGAADEEGPPPPAPPPPPAAASGPTFSAVVAGVPIRLTGILHAAIIGTQGVQSFGLPTPVAATSALNPAILANPDDANLSFQVQQTRLGMIVGEGTDFRGQVEIDFVHFDQSSPTTQAFPRIRIGVLEWRFAPDHRLFLGQTWDIFGNAIGPQLLAHSSNMVGTLFQAGNIGFMRHQLGWMGRFGDLEVAIAAGLQGANTGPSFNNIEESFTPTGAARVMLHIGESSVIGISGIGSALRFTQGSMQERRLALGGELFGDLTLGPLSIHAEAYLAQNLANMGALNLGHGRFGADVADAGGYVSARLTLGDHAITAMFGGAGVLNPGDVVPGYAPPDPMGTSTIGTPNLAFGPGMEFNMSGHVGYWYSPVHGLSIVLEPYFYVTRFKYTAADAARFDRDRVAFGAQLVGMFQF